MGQGDGSFDPFLKLRSVMEKILIGKIVNAVGLKGEIEYTIIPTALTYTKARNPSTWKTVS